MIEKDEALAIKNDRLRYLATSASIGVSAILIAAKLAAYLMTDSVSVLSSLFDSTFDLVASLVTAYGVASAMRPPDQQHRYGHGKAEPLAALAQSVFVMGSSVLLAYEAVNRFYRPRPIENELVGYGVMILSIALTMGLISFQQKVVKQTGSSAISADRMHYASDLAINLAVIVAFVLQRVTGFAWFDPVFAIGISIGLLYSAFQILRHALVALMDAEVSPEIREKIIAIVRAQPGVFGLHDMRTRSDSDRIFVELHVEMDGNITLQAAHDLAEKIGIAVAKEIPNADVLVHQDPAGHEEYRLDTQIEKRWGKK